MRFKFPNILRSILFGSTILLFHLSVIGRAPKNSVLKKVIIVGEFQTNVNDGLEIRLSCYNGFSANFTYPDSRSLRQKVNGKTFKFILDSIEGNCYVSIIYPESIENYQLGLPLILLDANDSIHLLFTDHGITYSGRGSDRFHLQIDICNLKYSFKFKQFAKVNYNYFVYHKIIFDSIFMKRISLLRKHRNIFSVGDFKQLCTDNRAETDYILMKDLRFPYYHAPAVSDIKRFYAENYLFKRIDTTNSVLKVKSRSYIDYILEKEKSDLRMAALKDQPTLPDYKDGELFSKLKMNYRGLLRDKLLTAYFLSSYSIVSASKPDLEKHLKEALTIIHASKYNQWMRKLYHTMNPGSAVYVFKLPDTSGKLYSPLDFGDKVLIIDFWFTGCENCALLNQLMKPIKEYFKKDSHVVFISICADRDKDAWINSIKGGLYTDLNSINLYTNGQGMDHKLIKFYNYDGLPQLLIIKSGKIFSSHPPVPHRNLDNGTELNESMINFIKLIQSAA
jgi:thiol-disulfide isomerase/thioredoxin